MPASNPRRRPNPPRLLFSSAQSRIARGQVTAEWLMLALLSLALLGIAATAISSASSAQTGLAERSMLRMEAEEMGHYADEICVMGEGNARTVALAPVAFALAYDDASKNLTIFPASRNGWNHSRTVLCPIEANETGYAGRAYLRYQPMHDAGGAERPGVLILAKP